jgi:hypothetical protein
MWIRRTQRRVYEKPLFAAGIICWAIPPVLPAQQHPTALQEAFDLAPIVLLAGDTFHLERRAYSPFQHRSPPCASCASGATTPKEQVL